MQNGIQIKKPMASLLCGCILTLASVVYSVKLAVLDVEAYSFGFPFYWLEKERHTWMAEPSEPWAYKIIWQGLIGNIIFWSILSFIAIILLDEICKHHKKAREA